MTKPLSQRRSRIFLTILFAIMIVLSLAAALMIQRGLADTVLQDQLREIEATR